MRIPVTATSISLTLLLSTSIAAQQPMTLSALGPIDTATTSPNGAPDSFQTPAGPLPQFFTQGSATVGIDPVADSFASITANVADYQLTVSVNAAVNITQSPSSAVVSPFDLLLNVSFASPSFAQLNLESVSALDAGPAFSSLAVDFGNDGTIEYSVSASAPAASIQLPLGTTAEIVRITGFASATAASATNRSLRLTAIPTQLCTTVQTAPACAFPNVLLTTPEFDGDTYIRFIADSLGTTPLLVFGLSAISTPLPIAGPLGPPCLLEPMPDIVVPMTQISSVLAEFTLPYFQSPTAPTPFTFYMQTLALDGTLTTANTSRAVMITCP